MSPEMMAAAGVASGMFAGILLLAFVALGSWCYSARRRPMFDAAARMPLEDDTYRSTVPMRLEDGTYPSTVRPCCARAPEAVVPMPREADTYPSALPSCCARAPEPAPQPPGSPPQGGSP